MSAIGKALRELREEKGWTLAQTAPKLDLTISLLSKRERGEIEIKRGEWKAICRVFGITQQEWEDRWRASEITRTVGGVGIPVINRAPAGVVVDYGSGG